MKLTKILAIVALCLLVVTFGGVTIDRAYAQDSDAAKNVDKDVAQRRGVSGALAKKKEDEGNGPNKTQMAVGIGSIFVMIIVMKWL